MNKADAEKILMNLIENLKLTRKEYELLVAAIAILKEPKKE